MRRITKAGAAAAGLTLLLGACSSSDTATDETTAPVAGGELLIWADPKPAPAVEAACTTFATDNGVSCKVKKVDLSGLRDQVIKANTSGDVPDLFIGPHDWLGELTKNGVVAPIDLGANAANFSEAAVAAANYDGTNYGVPWGVENVGLLMNTSLSPECPASLDELVDNGLALKKDGKVTLPLALQIGETGDAYHWYPLYSADGGYIFAQNADGSYDPSDMGVGQEGSVAASKRLSDLASEGVVKASVSYDIAKETFNKGKAPYFISGPWQTDESGEALGDDFTVCPIPNWDGQSAISQPFIGVQMFFQTAKAANPTIASTFLNDTVMTTEFMDSIFASDPRPPAWNESFDKAATNPIIAAFGEYGKQGIPLPAIPEMASVWGDLGLAEYKIASGDDPTKTIEEAGASINKAIGNS